MFFNDLAVFFRNVLFHKIGYERNVCNGAKAFNHFAFCVDEEFCKVPFDVFGA